MNDFWIGAGAFALAILTSAVTTTWTLAKIKEQLGNDIETVEKRLTERISNIEKLIIRLEAVAELNKERIERIQGIFELKINNINLEIEKLERKIGNLRAEIDKRLTLRKPKDE
jgi:peptidoglycan hydrolase CwlO-like protein